jgi:hypothetical protein
MMAVLAIYYAGLMAGRVPLFAVMNTFLSLDSQQSSFGGVVGAGNSVREKGNVSRFD